MQFITALLDDCQPAMFSRGLWKFLNLSVHFWKKKVRLTNNWGTLDGNRWTLDGNRT